MAKIARIIPITLLFCLLFAFNSAAITRDAVIINAADYANYLWHCSESNADSNWNDYVAGTNYNGVAYN